MRDQHLLLIRSVYNTVWSLGAISYGDKVGLMTGPESLKSNDYILPSLNVTFEHAENRVITLLLIFS